MTPHGAPHPGGRRNVGSVPANFEGERVGAEHRRVVDFSDGDGDRRRIRARGAVARDELELIRSVVVGGRRIDESRRRAGQRAVTRRDDDRKRDRSALGISPDNTSGSGLSSATVSC